MTMKSNSFYFNILSESRRVQKSYIDDIEKLRSKGDNASNIKADNLRNELIEERKFIDRITKHYNENNG
jgi:hypothetical protein